MPTRALIAPTSQRLRRLPLSGLGGAGLGKRRRGRLARVVALAILALLSSSCESTPVLGPPFRVEVVEFRSPCPEACTTLPEHNSDEQFMLFATTEAYDTANPETGLDEYPKAIYYTSDYYTSDYYNPGRHVDCLLQFGATLQPDNMVDFLALSQRVSWRRWDSVINMQTDAGGRPETPGWSIELVGDVPIIPARGEDLTEYLQQDFHIIGAPEEYIEPDPDSCTGDLRSLSFDFRFIPLNPYGG